MPMLHSSVGEITQQPQYKGAKSDPNLGKDMSIASALCDARESYTRRLSALSKFRVESLFVCLFF